MAIDKKIGVDNIDLTKHEQADEKIPHSEENPSTYLENAPDGVYLSDLKGTFLYGNKKAEEITGYKREELIGRSFLKLNMLPAKHLAKAAKLLAINLLGRSTGPDEFEIKRKDNRCVRVEINTTPVKERGKAMVIGFVRDITERKLAEEKIIQIAKEWQSTFDSITDLVSIQDRNFKLVRVNKAYADAFQKKPEELAGRYCYEVVHKTSCPIDNCPHQRALETQESTTSEIFEPSLGVYLEVSCSPIFNEQGEMEGTIHIAKNITERKQLQQKLEETATHDYLTGLPNRVLLIDRFTVAAALAHRNKSRLAVMSLDIDKFKSVNDSLGHGAGDQVLKVISTRLTGIIRASDTIARIGGDEFILVMLETNQREDATVIAQKILDSFTEPLSIDGHQLHLSTSIGIAICPEDAEDMETLIKKSDAAMYYSKDHGRNQFKFFGDGDVQLSGDHKSANLI